MEWSWSTCNRRSTWPSTHSAAPAAAVSVWWFCVIEYFKDGSRTAGCDLVEEKAASGRTLGKRGQVPPKTDFKRKLANWLWLLNVSHIFLCLLQKEIVRVCLVFLLGTLRHPPPSKLNWNSRGVWWLNFLSVTYLIFWPEPYPIPFKGALVFPKPFPPSEHRAVAYAFI